MIEQKLTVSDGSVSPCIEIDKRHIEAIAHEYWAAKEKHPKFCDAVLDPDSSVSWTESEYRIKLRNQRGPEYADNILMEEVAEAFAAYEQGNLEHALQEFAQCGSVILRIMENVQNELEKKNNEIIQSQSRRPLL